MEYNPNLDHSKEQEDQYGQEQTPNDEKAAMVSEMSFSMLLDHQNDSCPLFASSRGNDYDEDSSVSMSNSSMNMSGLFSSTTTTSSLNYQPDEQRRDNDDHQYNKFRDSQPSLSFTDELLSGVQPRRVQVWTPDDAVTECFNCHVAYGILTRRHHCRACGRIFCFQCCARKTLLPRDIIRYPVPIESESPSLGETKQAATIAELDIQHVNRIQGNKIAQDQVKKERVCQSCYKKIKKLRPICVLVREYDEKGYTVEQLINDISLESEEAKQAVLLSLSTFREIQYRLPSQPMSDREVAMIKNNVHLLQGHGAWIVPLLKANCSISMNHWNQSSLFPSSPCRTIMCTRYCKPCISHHDAIYILTMYAELEEALVEKCIQTLENVKDIWLPHLTFALRTHPIKILKLLLSFGHHEKEPDNEDKRLLVFWLLRMWLHHAKHTKQPAMVTIYEQALQHFCTEEDRALQDGARLVQLMMCDDRHGVHALAQVCKEMQLPVLAPNRHCIAIDTDKCEVKQSATRPTTYPCTLDNGSKVKILVKREDVRTDLIMMNTVRYMVDILEREEGLNLGVVTYNIIPTSIDGGLIEIVEGASTLYHIKHQLRKSVFKHIVETNDHEPSRDVRARFVRSTAAYCVITYLLGVGDRHLENIMITKDGRLFHIDYGFVLGNDPKPMAASVIRISPDMVEAIGDVGSQQYLEFEALCTRIYNALRRHVRPISMMLSLLVDMGITTRETLDQHIMRRFVPGENTVQAQLQLSKRIEGSRTSYSQSAIDMSHHQARVVSSANEYVSRPLRRAFKSFESWYWSGSTVSPGTSPP